jgi:hypothetical protein
MVGPCHVTAMLAALLVATGCFTSHVRTSHTDAGNFHESRSFQAASPFDYQKSGVLFTNYLAGSGALPTYELRLIEWAERPPEVDRRRIGLIGFSLGPNWMRRGIWDFLEARLLSEPPTHPDEGFTTHDTRPLALRVQP